MHICMSIYILGFRKAGGQITRKQYFNYYFGDIRGQPRGASKKLKGKLHSCLSNFHKNILILDNLEAQVRNCKVRYIHVYLMFTKYFFIFTFSSGLFITNFIYSFAETRCTDHHWRFCP